MMCVDFFVDVCVCGRLWTCVCRCVDTCVCGRVCGCACVDVEVCVGVDVCGCGHMGDHMSIHSKVHLRPESSGGSSILARSAARMASSNTSLRPARVSAEHSL